VVRYSVRTVCGRDVDLDDDQIRCVLEIEPFHVFILNLGLVFVSQVAGQRGEAERRKERVLDRPP
jgi:hypothetical protein